MLAECQFLVTQGPVPQPRQRFFARSNFRTGKAVPVPYKDETSPVHSFKDEVKLRAREVITRAWPMGEKIGYRLLALFFMPPPLSLPKRRMWGLPCVTKPDLDNLVKSVKDALTGILYDDDGRVFDERLLKLYPPPGMGAGLRVLIQAVDYRAPVTTPTLDALIGAWRANTFERYDEDPPATLF